MGFKKHLSRLALAELGVQQQTSSILELKLQLEY